MATAKPAEMLDKLPHSKRLSPKDEVVRSMDLLLKSRQLDQYQEALNRLEGGK
jgi:protein-arginine kinase